MKRNCAERTLVQRCRPFPRSLSRVYGIEWPICTDLRGEFSDPAWLDAVGVDDRYAHVPPRIPSPGDCGPELGHPLGRQPSSVRELVVAVPAPSDDHGQHEDPAAVQERQVDIWVEFADTVGCMG